jgi:hypothetical protein
MSSRKAKDAMGLPQGWRPTVSLFVCLGSAMFALFLLSSAADYWHQEQKLSLMVQLDQRDPDQLSAGETVWGDGVIQDSTPTHVNDLVFGCIQTYSSADQGSWSTDRYFFPEWLALEDGGLEFSVFLDEACPDGEHELLTVGDTRWKGYRQGQRFAYLGTVRKVDPLQIEAEEHWGGSAEEYRDNIQGMAQNCAAAGGAVSAVWATLLMWSLLGISRREQWTGFAWFNGLDTPGRFPLQLGHVFGQYKGRKVRFRRRRGLGDGGLLPADVCLEVGLNPCMQGYKMRPQGQLEPLLKLTGEAEIDDPIMDRLFVLQGVDASRWRQLLSEEEVNDRLSDLSSDGISIRMDRGTLELSWPGLGTGAMGVIMERACDLAHAMEGAEGRGWQTAADALDLHFEHGSEGWSIGEDGSEAPLLRYVHSNPRLLVMSGEWITSLEAAVDTPPHWSIEAGPSKEGQRTGDPVLDSHVCLRGFEDTALAQLLSAEDATETVMAAICGHGIRLWRGELRAEMPGLLVDPTELITDARRLHRLLKAQV